MRIYGTTRLLGILGYPVAHSYSPAMHNAAIAELGLDLVYLPLPIAPENLECTLQAMQALNFLGANVTLPHKTTILPFLDGVSELSQLIGAVNTLEFRNGKISGTTTDPIGFLAGFTEAGYSFTGKSVAILGNGGTARTVAYALLHLANPNQVSLVARNMEKSHGLAQEISQKLGKQLGCLDLETYRAKKQDFEIVVHATPMGMSPNIQQSILRAEDFSPSQVVYDLVYNPEQTQLLQLAKTQGCPIVGGLGMLVHQGLASFQLWTQKTPNPETFYRGIRQQQATA